MNKLLKCFLATAVCCAATLAVAADNTKSMRGADVAAPDGAGEMKAYAGKRPGTQKPIVRTFSTQPPMISHAIDYFDEITLETNQCLDCHAVANFKQKFSPRVPDSHLLNREGKKLADASTDRYNCVLCHVPQVDAPALVENTFKGDTPKKSAAVTPAAAPAAKPAVKN